MPVDWINAVMVNVLPTACTHLFIRIGLVFELLFLCRRMSFQSQNLLMLSWLVLLRQETNSLPVNWINAVMVNVLPTACTHLLIRIGFVFELCFCVGECHVRVKIRSCFPSSFWQNGLSGRTGVKNALPVYWINAVLVNVLLAAWCTHLLILFVLQMVMSELSESSFPGRRSFREKGQYDTLSSCCRIVSNCER